MPYIANNCGSKIIVDHLARQALLRSVSLRSASPEELAVLHALARAIATSVPRSRAEAVAQWSIAREYVDLYAQNDIEKDGEEMRSAYVSIIVEAATRAAPLLQPDLEEAVLD